MRNNGAVTAVASFGLLVLACGGGRGGGATQPPPSPPTILVEPVDVTIQPCGGATFTVQATGTPPLAYQWLLNDQPISGATESGYRVSRAGIADSGARYSVMVTNAAGSVPSRAATILVIDPGGPITLATTKVFGGMAVDGADLFWTDGLAVNVASVNCSGPVRSLYERTDFFENTYAMVLAPDRVVWTDQASGAIRSVPKDGGSPTTIASQLGTGVLYLLTLSGTELFWPNLSYGIQTVSIDGGTMVTYPVGEFISAGGVAADDLYVYWTDVLHETVNRMPVAGGAMTVLASGQPSPNAILSDGQSVYWTSAANWNTDSPTGYVMKVNREGGAPVVLASQPTLTFQLALDASFVYWTGGLLNSTSIDSGSISKVPRDGGQDPTVIASGRDSPFDIAVDSQYVYWGERGRVMRLPK